MKCANSLCNKQIDNKKKNAKYCSDRCRNNSYLANNRLSDKDVKALQEENVVLKSQVQILQNKVAELGKA
jgi:hypothetical protein